MGKRSGLVGPTAAKPAKGFSKLLNSALTAQNKEFAVKNAQLLNEIADNRNKCTTWMHLYQDLHADYLQVLERESIRNNNHVAPLPHFDVAQLRARAARSSVAIIRSRFNQICDTVVDCVGRPEIEHLLSDPSQTLNMSCLGAAGLFNTSVGVGGANMSLRMMPPSVPSIREEDPLGASGMRNYKESVKKAKASETILSASPPSPIAPAPIAKSLSSESGISSDAPKRTVDGASRKRTSHESPFLTDDVRAPARTRRRYADVGTAIVGDADTKSLSATATPRISIHGPHATAKSKQGVASPPLVCDSDIAPGVSEDSISICECTLVAAAPIANATDAAKSAQPPPLSITLRPSSAQSYLHTENAVRSTKSRSPMPSFGAVEGQDTLQSRSLEDLEPRAVAASLPPHPATQSNQRNESSTTAPVVAKPKAVVVSQSKSQSAETTQQGQLPPIETNATKNRSKSKTETAIVEPIKPKPAPTHTTANEFDVDPYEFLMDESLPRPPRSTSRTKRNQSKQRTVSSSSRTKTSKKPTSRTEERSTAVDNSSQLAPSDTSSSGSQPKVKRKARESPSTRCPLVERIMSPNRGSHTSHPQEHPRSKVTPKVADDIPLPPRARPRRTTAAQLNYCESPM